MQIPQQIGHFLVLILRDQIWQGIGSLAGIASLLLALFSAASDKSKQKEIDDLKRLLGKGVMYHQATAPPAQRKAQKTPLSKLLNIARFVLPFSPSVLLHEYINEATLQAGLE